jgi:D-alanyl-D-alanine carboxypeptidase
MSDAFPVIQRIDARLAEIARRATTLGPLAPTGASSVASSSTNASDTFQSTLERMLATEATNSLGTAMPTSGSSLSSLGYAGASSLSSLAYSGASSRSVVDRYTALHKTPGTYGSLVVPADVRAHGNGTLPDTALRSIGQGDHRLATTAATAYRSMAAAARADGVELKVSDSYRTLDQQVAMQAARGNYDEGGFAATPGTSPHGWGLAIDLDTPASSQQWMRQNAWRFGFAEDVAREPWHWTYRGTNPT